MSPSCVWEGLKAPPRGEFQKGGVPAGTLCLGTPCAYFEILWPRSVSIEYVIDMHKPRTFATPAPNSSQKDGPPTGSPFCGLFAPRVSFPHPPSHSPLPNTDSHLWPACPRTKGGRNVLPEWNVQNKGLLCARIFVLFSGFSLKFN